MKLNFFQLILRICEIPNYLGDSFSPSNVNLPANNEMHNYLLVSSNIIKNKYRLKVEEKEAPLYLRMLENYNFNKQKSYKFESVIENPRHLQIGDGYTRIYYLAGLPSLLFAASVFRLINLPISLTLSYHLCGTNKASMIKATRQRISVLESSRNGQLNNGKNGDPEQLREMEELHQFLNDLVCEREKAFLTGIYVSINAESLQELLEYDKKFQDETQNIELTFNTYSFAQKRAFTSMLPLNTDTVNEKHLIPTSAAINLLPFLTKNLNDPTGIFFGINQYNSSLILLDLFKARNANINIFGTSGSGKSVTAKLLITRLAMRSVQSIILDPEGEYGRLCYSLGGQNIKLGSEYGIDPFVVFFYLGVNISDQVQILKHFFSFFIQKQNLDSSLLDKVLMRLIAEEKRPSIFLFLQYLVDIVGETNLGICNDIRQLVEGSLSMYFKMDKQLDLNSDIICFDLSQLKTDEQKLPFLYLLGSIINRLLDQANRQRMVFIDEAHKLLSNKITTDFYIDLVKTARKRKAGIVSITQNPEDFKESDNSRTIITQSETTILLKQASASINYISRFDLFKLTDRESADLATFAIGESLFIREREHIYLNVFPFDSEAELVFTS